MQVMINTDHNIDGREAVAGRITGLVEDALRHVSDHVTRVEVHLTDENSDQKGGVGAMRCVIEARIEGRQPLSASDEATSLDDAVLGTAHKLARLIDNTLGRLRHREGRRH